MDLDDITTPGLDPPDALRDVHGLSHGMRVPRVSGARGKSDDVDADA
jgi:hypothetical protein